MCPDDTARIPLRAKDGSVRAYALIDAADAEWVSQWRWHLMTGYAHRNGTRRGSGRGHKGMVGKQSHVFLHREVLGLTEDDPRRVDHINRDRLDCRRSNLRIVTHAGNMQNVPSRGGSSSYRGVGWHKASGKWSAFVTVQQKRQHLGLFSSEAEAAEAARLTRLRLMPYSND